MLPCRQASLPVLRPHVGKNKNATLSALYLNWTKWGENTCCAVFWQVKCQMYQLQFLTHDTAHSVNTILVSVVISMHIISLYWSRLEYYIMAVLMCLLRLQVMAMHQADVHSGNIYLSIYIYIYIEREREREWWWLFPWVRDFGSMFDNSFPTCAF